MEKEFVVNWRERYHVSQSALASLASIHQPDLSNMESGKIGITKFTEGKLHEAMRNYEKKLVQAHDARAAIEEDRHGQIIAMSKDEMKARINDGGTRVSFDSGAIREGRVGKGRYDLLTPVGLRRLAEWYELGAKKYDDRNWEKGLPISGCMESAMRHWVKYMDGQTDEDHLAAIAWNVFSVMHFEEKMPEIMDIPSRMNGGK
jgi:transcriptional regulator with XRE-family HTH domain